MRHVIKKQVIYIRTSNRQDAFRLQHLMSAHYYNEIVNALEEVFDKCCGEDETISIDVLEVDFGTVSEDDLEKARWNELFLEKFKANLLERLKTFSAGKAYTNRSSTVNVCKQWLFYIQHGYLNWNTVRVDEAWLNNVLQALATDYNSVGVLRELILKDDTIANRIVAQHNALFLARLTETLTAQTQKNLARSVEEIFTLLEAAADSGANPMSHAAFIQAVWLLIIRLAATGAQNLATEKIVAGLLHKYIITIPVQKKKQRQMLARANVIKPLLQDFIESKMMAQTQDTSQLTRNEEPVKHKKNIEDLQGKAANKDAEKRTTETNEGNARDTRDSEFSAKVPSPEDAVAEEFPPAPAKKNEDKSISKKDNANEPGIDKPAQKKISPDKQNEKAIESLFKQNKAQEDAVPNEWMNENAPVATSYNDEIPEEGIFIRNAGIVLTHPFLSSLFKRLEWLEDGNFKNRAVQLKAVFMLHYLATGETAAPEYDLVLCKHICGYPIAKSVPSEMIFSGAELDEANNMLTAVIEQWDKLGNTSIAGLRESFLQRSGKLFIRNDVPCVHVESHGIDILIEFLPWHLSIIRLPWRKKILSVEWRR